MVWVIGGAILYFVLIVTLGVMTIRKGHWVIFVIGIFLPFFWLIGAMLPSRRRVPTRGVSDVTTPVTGISGVIMWV